MLNNNKEVQLSQIKEYIDHLDFSQIIDKMIKHQGWLRSDAEQVCQQYRNFLFLNAKYGKEYKIPPSEDIDEFWHNHILDTHKYREDCQAIFGEYLDHYPYFGIDQKTTFSDLEAAFAQMQELHYKEFGEYVYAVRAWPCKLLAILKQWFRPKPKKLSVRTLTV